MTDWKKGLSKVKLQAAQKDLLIGALRWPMEAEPTPMPFRKEQYGYVGEIDQGEYFYTDSYGSAGTVQVRILPKQGFNYTERLGFTKDGKTEAHMPWPIYKTKREALLACRWKVCRDFAGRLQLIDERLEDC